MKFRKKPVVIEAITFDEFVQFGRDSGATIVKGMPWHFQYKGFGISHENVTMRKYAPIIGLCGQPFWGYFAYQTKGWGLAALVVAYSLVYINGIRVQWGTK